MAVCFLEFLEKQYRQLKNEGQIFENNSSNDRVAVVVDPRRSDLLLRVIRNIMYFVGNRWNLHVFTSHENIGWLHDEFKECTFRITPMNKNNITREEYSTMLMSKDFWDIIPEENILVFQMDTLLFRKGMDEWIDGCNSGYDYVGANYYNSLHTAPITKGIQGGLSLRKRSAMIKCIEKIKREDIQEYRRYHGCRPLQENVIAEDVFFTHACEILKMRIPNIEKRREFSIEADYYPYTMGHHGLTRKYFTEDQQRYLLSTAELM